MESTGFGSLPFLGSQQKHSRDPCLLKFKGSESIWGPQELPGAWCSCSSGLRLTWVLQGRTCSGTQQCGLSGGQQPSASPCWRYRLPAAVSLHLKFTSRLRTKVRLAMLPSPAANGHQVTQQVLFLLLGLCPAGPCSTPACRWDLRSTQV